MSASPDLYLVLTYFEPLSFATLSSLTMGEEETRAHQRDDNQPVVNPEPVPLEPAAQYPQRNRNHGQDPRRNRRGNNDGAPVLGEVEAWRWWWQPTSHTYRYERHKGAATA